MSTNFVIVMGLILIELTIIVSSIITFILFKEVERELRNTRTDYNFRQAKLEEIFEGKNEINQLITGQYKLILEQYKEILAYWKVSGEYIKDLSEQYSVLEERYSDLYEQYDQINHRIEDIANAMKPVEEEEKTDES